MGIFRLGFSTLPITLSLLKLAPGDGSVSPSDMMICNVNLQTANLSGFPALWFLLDPYTKRALKQHYPSLNWAKWIKHMCWFNNPFLSFQMHWGCKPKLPDACQFPWTAWHNGAQVKVAQSRLTLCNPMDCTGHGILQPRILEWVAFPSPGDLPNLAIKPRCPALQVDSLSAEPQGKPKNTGVCSLPLLQWIFLTQESNQGLPHCRQILYQLSYQRSPGKYYLITLVHSYNSIQS